MFRINVVARTNCVTSFLERRPNRSATNVAFSTDPNSIAFIANVWTRNCECFKGVFIKNSCTSSRFFDRKRCSTVSAALCWNSATVTDVNEAPGCVEDRVGTSCVSNIVQFVRIWRVRRVKIFSHWLRASSLGINIIIVNVCIIMSSVSIIPNLISKIDLPLSWTGWEVSSSSSDVQVDRGEALGVAMLLTSRLPYPGIDSSSLWILVRPYPCIANAKSSTWAIPSGIRFLDTICFKRLAIDSMPSSNALGEHMCSSRRRSNNLKEETVNEEMVVLRRDLGEATLRCVDIVRAEKGLCMILD